MQALAFMHGRLKHVIVSAGSSQVAYFWDVKTGMLLYEIFTGTTVQKSCVISLTLQQIALQASTQQRRRHNNSASTC